MYCRYSAKQLVATVRLLFSAEEQSTTLFFLLPALCFVLAIVPLQPTNPDYTAIPQGSITILISPPEMA